MTTRRTFLHQLSYGAIGIGIISTFPYCRNAGGSAVVTDLTQLARSTPEMEGISSAAISRFIGAVKESGIQFHSFMLVRHGKVVAEGWWSPFESEFKHTLYSLSKSFTSTAVGLAVADGKLTVEDPVISFFPADVPATVSDNLAAMKIRHLLTMNTGHAVDTLGPIRDAGDDNWAKSFLAVPVEFEPGTHFKYNTGATYMLSNIVQKVMGRSVFDLLSERLFKPLHIEGADWETDPHGVSVGGFGLRVRTEDITKFGQLYLQKGLWNGEQILPAEWVETATSKQTESQEGDNDWSQGYGYQFWRCKPAPGFYRGDGAFGQFCIVIPQLDTVVAITGESFDLQRSMTLVWENILPALQESALPEDMAANDKMLADLGALSIAPLPASTPSPLVDQITGKEYVLGANPWNLDSVTFQFGADQCLFTLKGGGTSQTIACGMGKWITEGNEKTDPQSLFALPYRTSVSSKMAACAAWEDEKILHLKWKFLENVHGDNLYCTFDGEEVAIALQSSFAEGQNSPDERPLLSGKYRQG
ncbi:MAG TPA: serine hydrolase [Flavilitoribacter sp.]|nr:serine hydrolase [Flavilitoribacter sp.]